MRISSAPLRALGHTQFRRYWLGSLAYASAVRLVMLGQGWLVFELSRSPIDLGLLGAAMALPAILVTWVGGALADRLDKRKLLMVTSSVTTGLLLLQATLDLTGVVVVWQVISIAAVLGLVGGLEWPAMQAIFPNLIKRDHMMSAVALNAIVWQGTRMVIPAFGGLVIALWGTSVVFVAAGAGSLTMLAVLASLEIRASAETRPAGTGDFIGVMRFIAHQRLFSVLISLAWGAAFFGSSFLQLMPLFANLLGTGGAGFGVLMSASGVGSVVGTVLISAFPARRRLGWLILVSLFISGCALFGFSLIIGFAEHVARPLLIAVPCVAIVSLFNSMFMVSAMTVLQLAVPDALRGRVMAIHGVSFNLMPLGALFTGALAAVLGASWAVAVGASILVLASFAVIITQRTIRELDGGRVRDQSGIVGIG